MFIKKYLLIFVIVGVFLINGCTLAVEKGDISHCDELDSQEESTRRSCISSFATDQKDISFCSLIEDKEGRVKCGEFYWKIIVGYAERSLILCLQQKVMSKEECGEIFWAIEDMKK
jgi:hypothetical protein